MQPDPHGTRTVPRQLSEGAPVVRSVRAVDHDTLAMQRARQLAVIAVIEALFDVVFVAEEDVWPQRIGTVLSDFKRLPNPPTFAEAWAIAVDEYPPTKGWDQRGGDRSGSGEENAAKFFKAQMKRAYEGGV